MFDGVVAVSPSLWFGDGLIAREVATAKGVPSIVIAEGDGTAAAPVRDRDGARAGHGRSVDRDGSSPCA